MNEKDRSLLKTYFITGSKPTESQFGQLIDSIVVKSEDGVSIDKDTKCMGLGVTSPKAKLDIGVGGNTSALKIGHTTHNANFEIQPGVNGVGGKKLSINSANTTIINFLSNGNVGIGTANPAAKLDINGPLKLGSTEAAIAGTIRYTGSDFQGYVRGKWFSLTQAEGLVDPMHIPQPEILVRRGRVYAFWRSTGDSRFLSQNPQYHLFRYKSARRQTNQGDNNVTRFRPKKWAHPEHNHTPSSAEDPRPTEFAVSSQAQYQSLINFLPEGYFHEYGGARPAIPRGQGQINKNHPQFNRRFEYFCLRLAVKVNGKVHYGPPSETFSVGSRKGRTGYKLVTELVSPSQTFGYNPQLVL